MAPNIQPFDAIKNPNPELGNNDDYIIQMIHAAFAARPTLPQDDAAENAAHGFSGQPDVAYWLARVKEKPSWGAYWWDRIQIAFTDGTGGGSTGDGSGAPQGGGAQGALVNAQLGLLEDDLVYRLSLLATNVLQPLKDKYPNIVIVSGFRQVNTGIGQHELGEAVDLQIRNQSPEQLFEVADYINKFMNFDQLILNWTDIGDKQGWIHVSFSATSLRGQVLTKDLADAFHEGLFIVEPLTGEAAAAARRQQAADDAQILAELQNLQSRQDRLSK
jgi:hypothetical protein